MSLDEKKPTTVLVVDDQLLYREALCELANYWPEFRIVGQAGNGQEAVDFCAMLVPDLILMDVQMPKMDGIEATKLIKARHPEIKIVMLTVSADDEHLFGAIENGASGYILKDTPARQLRNRLQGIMEGQGALSGQVTAKVLAHLSSHPRKDDDSTNLSALTPRETELLVLVAKGRSNEEIGAELYLSPGTVKKKLSALMQKLDVENRVQLAVLATKAGLLDGGRS